MGLGARAKTKKREEMVSLARDTSTPQLIAMASRLEPGTFVNPVVRRFMDSPFVSTAADFEEEEKPAEAKREAKREEAHAKAAERQ